MQDEIINEDSCKPSGLSCSYGRGLSCFWFDWNFSYFDIALPHSNFSRRLKKSGIRTAELTIAGKLIENQTRAKLVFVICTQTLNLSCFVPDREQRE